MFTDPLKMGYGLQYVLGPDSSIRSWAVEWFNQLQFQSELPAFCQSGKRIFDRSTTEISVAIQVVSGRCRLTAIVAGR